MRERTVWGMRRAVVAMMFSAGLAGGAHAEDETKLPPMLANYMARTQVELDFFECVEAGVKARRLTDADLIRRIAEGGLADKTYAAVAAEVDDPDAMLRDHGFVPTQGEPQAALAEKAMMLANIATTEGDAADSMGPALGFSMGVNEAIGAGCAPPPHLLPGGDPLREKAETFGPLMGESERVRECAMVEMQARGIGEDAAYALLDRTHADAFRAQALAAVDAMPGVDAEHRGKVAQSDSLGALATRLTLVSAMTFDIESMARATGLTALYLDRALDAKCDPSDALQQFIGAH